MSTDTLQFQLNMIEMQLKRLERQVALLRQEIARSAPTANPPRTFSQLRGVWADVVFDEQDFEASRLKLPEGL
ncbi:MAG: hypothetical protein EYC68_02820 [Chloroflexota bacterium]|nr:MAG: hypothetical protein EYC68_02820 [Chloroflexota bacterium]